MQHILIYLFSLIFVTKVLAHDPNKAFFTISQNEHFTEVKAELPWTVRDDLIASAPLLQKSRLKSDFEHEFFRYVEKNLILTDNLGQVMKLVEVKELDNSGHSHQGNYIFKFEGKTPVKIRNTILFNSYTTQKNYHRFNLEDFKMDFIITPHEPEYTIQYPAASRFNSLFWIGSLIAIVIILAYILFVRFKY